MLCIYTHTLAKQGAKCWNGPKRSLSVTVICGGSDTKVISVEEPETCTYEMIMESYVACNEEFAQMNDFKTE